MVHFLSSPFLHLFVNSVYGAEPAAPSYGRAKSAPRTTRGSSGREHSILARPPAQVGFIQKWAADRFPGRLKGTAAAPRALLLVAAKISATLHSPVSWRSHNAMQGRRHFFSTRNGNNLLMKEQIAPLGGATSLFPIGNRVGSLRAKNANPDRMGGKRWRDRVHNLDCSRQTARGFKFTVCSSSSFLEVRMRIVQHISAPHS